MYEQNDKLRENIFSRHAEMERSSDSIQKLITSLDKQKEEVIEKIFAQVSGFFEEIFEKLVPAGRGRLIMIKKSATQVSPRIDWEEGGANEGARDEGRDLA